MKTVKFLEDIDQEIKANSVYNISEVAYEKLAQLKVKLEVLPESETAKILPSDKIPFAKILYDKEHKIKIQLPQNDSDSNFGKIVGENIKNLKIDIYWDATISKVIEVNEWKDTKTGRIVFGKKIVEPQRLKAILEEYFIFYVVVAQDDEFVEKIKSPSEQLLKFLPQSNHFRASLKTLNYVSESPYVYVDQGNIKVAKPGYNEDCSAYVRGDAPIIGEIDVGKAKEIINECFLDFPFESEQDKVFAVSSLITPMLRGIYQQYGVRTPIYAYLANQQGCGKDYCAGIRHVAYTGKFNEDAPISNDKGSSSEETQKEFVAAALTGQQFMHNSNCRGRLENASYEKQATSESIRGRALSTNIIIDSENILELSFSGNYGLSFNKDIARRTLFVNLFTDVEDTTKRKFTRDLHQWIRTNRAEVLSAIYTLIKTWWDAGHTPGDGINASYPTWAKFCSGVMKYHNLGDPCASGSMVINDIGGDTETKDICRFNKEIAEWLEDKENILSNYVTEHSKEGLTKKDIFSLFETVFANNDDRPFSRFDLQLPKDRRELGRTINRYVGTYRGGYKLIVSKDNEKLDRVKYKLIKAKQVVPTVPTVPVLHSKSFFGENLENNYIESKVNPVDPVGTNLADKTQEYINKLLEKGDIVEIRPGEYQKVI